MGLNGNIFQYIKAFLTDRYIITNVNNTLSSARQINMGIPQGSIIAPILFNIMLYDLPHCLSKSVNVVQYADDIAMWMNVPLKKKTGLRFINHIKRLYQTELDKLNKYMIENGFEFSVHKTNMILFNNGADPRQLPNFHIGGQNIPYTSEVKFLGLVLTPKLNWKKHINMMLMKGLKSFNLIKVVSR